MLRTPEGPLWAWAPVWRTPVRALVPECTVHLLTISYNHHMMGLSALQVCNVLSQMDSCCSLAAHNLMQGTAGSG